MKSNTPAKSDKIALPKGIKASDLKYPNYKSKNKLVYEGAHRGSLTFHYVPSRGWVIATLPISNARRNSGFEDRTYAIEVQEKPYTPGEHNIVTVGKGPHITKTIQVYITTKRVKALKPYIDIFSKGLASAGNIRDRISTRRTQTVLRRSGSPLGWF